ncbi:MAG: helix-turn-helix transcriptional regulator [Paludibacteraceae bacterium]
MKYNDIQEIAKSKNIKIKDLLERVGYSRKGLNEAIDNETIDLRRLKLLCETLRISPAQFFETGTFGIMKSNEFNKKNENAKDMEIEYLKNRLKDKDDIISLLREKRSGYGIASEPTYK